MFAAVASALWQARIASSFAAARHKKHFLVFASQVPAHSESYLQDLQAPNVMLYTLLSSQRFTSSSVMHVQPFLQPRSFLQIRWVVFGVNLDLGVQGCSITFKCLSRHVLQIPTSVQISPLVKRGQSLSEKHFLHLDLNPSIIFMPAVLRHLDQRHTHPTIPVYQVIKS